VETEENHKNISKGSRDIDLSSFKPDTSQMQVRNVTTRGRAMAQATSRRPLTAGGRVRSQAGQVVQRWVFHLCSIVYHLHNTTNLLHSVVK